MASVSVQKWGTAAACRGQCIHVYREGKGYANPDIDPDKAGHVWAIGTAKECQKSIRETIAKIDKKRPPKRVKRDRKTVAELCVPAPREGTSQEDAMRFFAAVYDELDTAGYHVCGGAVLLRTAEAVRDELPRLEASRDALRAQEEKSRQDAADAAREAQETRQRAQEELRTLFPPGRAADALEEREYKTGLLSRERVLVATDPDAVTEAVRRADAVARTLDARDAEQQQVTRLQAQVEQLTRERDAAVDRAAQEHFDAVLGRALTVPDVADQIRECSYSEHVRQQLRITAADAARIERVLREDSDRDRDAAMYQTIIQVSRRDRQLRDALIRSGVCPDVERRQSHEHSLSL